MYLVNFFPEAHQYRIASPVYPFPETKHYQSPLSPFQKKINYKNISRKSLFKNKKVSTSSRVNPYAEAKQDRIPNRTR